MLNVKCHGPIENNDSLVRARYSYSSHLGGNFKAFCTGDPVRPLAGLGQTFTPSILMTMHECHCLRDIGLYEEKDPIHHRALTGKP